MRVTREMNWTGTLSTLAVGLGVLGAAQQSRAAAITITPVYAGSITSDANAAAIEAGIQNAINEITSNIATATSTPLNVTITFGTMSSGLGQSSQGININIPYSNYRSALIARATSANDNTAIANLPNTSSFSGISTVELPFPLARSLGLANTSDNATISLNTSLMNLTRTGTPNPTLYDLQTVAMHEIDEVLGVGGPATSLGGGQQGSNLGSLDVFRYSAAGTPSYSTTSAAYLSIDGGVTNVMSFNTGGGDLADWASNATHYVQDAFGTPGTYRDLSTPELTAYDVIGYTLIPEPTSCAAVGLGLMMLARRRRA